jgi:hypothetical protein
MFTYDENLFSDFHKDAYGFRPRDHRFYDATPAEKQVIWDDVGRAFDDANAQEELAKRESQINFEKEVQYILSLGASNRETALRWMTDDRTFYTRQDVEGWVYNRGILFTDYGRELVKELMDIVKFESEEYA